MATSVVQGSGTGEGQPGLVASLLVERFGLPSVEYMQLKYRRTVTKARAFLAFVQRSLCGMSYKEICGEIGNMSMGGVSKLCSEGYRLFIDEEKYRVLYREVLAISKVNL